MIYLCIPAHNEEQTVGVVLWKLRQVMAELERDYQILVADDASTDRTPRVLEPYTRILPLTVLHTDERRGYAASLEMLLREAVARSDYPKRDTLVVLQADFTEEPAHVAALVKRIESGADIVASNTLAETAGPRLTRWKRPLLNALLRRLGWPDGVRDPLRGFNAYRVFCVRRAIEERKEERLLHQEGWAANAQLLQAAAPHARRVDTIDFEPHGERLQRPSRCLFMPALKQVLALRRDRRPEGVLPVGALRPDAVSGGAASRRRLMEESLRDITTAPRGRGRQQAASASRSRNGAQRARPEQDGRKPARAGNGESRRAEPARRQRGQAPAAGAATGGGPAAGKVVAETAPNGPALVPQESGEAKSRRSRRGRRGSSRARADATAGPQQDAGAEPSSAASVANTETTGKPVTDVAALEAGPVNGAAPAAAEPASGSAESEAPPRRRRSGRRGGRGRRRRTNGEASTQGAAQESEAHDTAGEAGPADFSPPVEPTSTPKAS